MNINKINNKYLCQDTLNIIQHYKIKLLKSDIHKQLKKYLKKRKVEYRQLTCHISKDFLEIINRKKRISTVLMSIPHLNKCIIVEENIYVVSSDTDYDEEFENCISIF